MEDIGRAAAHQRHERVELLFRQHDGGAEQPEQVQNHGEHVFGQRRILLDAEHACAHEGGGIRHDAHHMAAALYRVAQIVQCNPGGDGNDDGFRLQGGQGFGEHAADEVGLHPDDEDVAAGGDAGDIRYGGYALGTEWLKTLRRAVVAVEFQTGNLGEPAEDGPAHVAAADAADTLAAEGCRCVHDLPFLKMSRAEQVRHREMKRPLSSAVVRESFAAAPKEDRDPQEACYG